MPSIISTSDSFNTIKPCSSYSAFSSLYAFVYGEPVSTLTSLSKAYWPSTINACDAVPNLRLGELSCLCSIACS